MLMKPPGTPSGSATHRAALAALPANMALLKEVLCQLALNDVIAVLFPDATKRTVSREDWVEAFTTELLISTDILNVQDDVFQYTISWYFGAIVHAANPEGEGEGRASLHASLEAVTAALSTQCVINRGAVCEEVFRVFDFDKNGTLSRDEIGSYLHTVVSLTLRLRDPSAPLDLRNVAGIADTLTSAMFNTIDVDHSDSVDVHEFREWLDTIVPSAETSSNDAMESDTAAAPKASGNDAAATTPRQLQPQPRPRPPSPSDKPQPPSSREPTTPAGATAQQRVVSQAKPPHHPKPPPPPTYAPRVPGGIAVPVADEKSAPDSSVAEHASPLETDPPRKQGGSLFDAFFTMASAGTSPQATKQNFHLFKLSFCDRKGTH